MVETISSHVINM